MDKEELLKLEKELEQASGDKESQLLLSLVEEIKKIHLIIPTPMEREVELQKLYEKIAEITERKTKELTETINKSAAENQILERLENIKLELPEQFKIEIPKAPEFPKEIKVSNLPTPTKFPDEIKLKKPDWYKQANQQDIIDSLEELISAVKENKKPNLEAYREPGRALAVRLVNRKGSDFYEAVMGAIGSMGAGSFPFENASKTAKAALVDNDGHIQVDVLTGGGGGIQYAEDTVHNSGDTGTMSLGVRTDTPVSLAADGDYHPFIFSNKGGLWVDLLPNEVDSGNSSTATLTSGSVFTGAGKEILEFDIVTITLDASHDSATNGMQFQFSTDNTNWDDVYNFTYTAADGARRFQFPVTSRYFRVVYTNGGTNQTHFRMQTILHHGNTLTTIHRLNDDVSPDRSATIVKSAIVARAAGTGDFKAVQSTAAGNLKMSVQEISDGLDIGAGNAGSESQRISISTDDVNLSAIKKSIIGASAPTIDSYTQVAINLNAGANQVLVSSAPNKQIWVYGVVYTCSVAGTVSFQDELDVAITGIMDHAANSGLSHPTSGNFAMPIWKLATDKDLEVDVVTAAIDGWLDYAIVSV